MTMTEARQTQLEAAYEANLAAGNAPYANVAIHDTEELTWIYDQRSWAARFWLTTGKSRANLSHANLSHADLSGADLSRADLSDADLSDADLSGADLSDANLSDADLSDADLSRADLSGANLSGANLSGADLSGANLSGADLSDADLAAIKYDIYDIVDRVPLDLPYLIDALEQGEVDGSAYRNDWEQGCLVGTLEMGAEKRLRLAGENPHPHVELDKNSSRPAERWFLGIHLGDTPANSTIAAWTIGVLKERLTLYDRLARAWQSAEPVSTP